MATTYNIEVTGDVMTVGFGAPSQNDHIVRDASARLSELIASGALKGGELLKVTGPASLPVAFVLAHPVAHLYATIAVYDPKLNGFVVAIAHGPHHQVGDLVE